MPEGDHEGKKKENEKTGFFTQLRQQRIPAWQPILTPGSVLPSFFVIGMVFVPIGIGLLIVSNQVKSISFMDEIPPGTIMTLIRFSLS